MEIHIKKGLDCHSANYSEVFSSVYLAANSDSDYVMGTLNDCCTANSRAMHMDLCMALYSFYPSWLSSTAFLTISA